MAEVHFLNVLDGDCSIIRHASGNITVIDVNNAKKETSNDYIRTLFEQEYQQRFGLKSNLQQKNNPENPIKYLKNLNVGQIFRFILTHPDMDHMGGIKDFFGEFNPINFWDIHNKKEISLGKLRAKDVNDWFFYKSLRDGTNANLTRLTPYSNSYGKYWNRDAGGGSGDALYILAPTEELINAAIDADDYNDASYVFVYYAYGGKILFGGDSHDKTWEHILRNHSAFVRNIDILIAPHHGRKSSRSYEFLDVLRPKITFFGNAPSQNLAYSAWNYRKLPYITNNQAGNIVINTSAKPMEIFVSNYAFALKNNPHTCYMPDFKGYYLGHLIN